MKVIGVKCESRQQGEFVFDSLKEAVEKKRLALDDIALVNREEDGKVALHQTIDTGLRSRFTDRGINDKMMKRAGDELGENGAIVFALGADASVDAVAAKVKELTDGALETFIVAEDKDDDGLLREAAVDVSAPDHMMVRAPYS